jgi:hypothetical protein
LRNARGELCWFADFGFEGGNREHAASLTRPRAVRKHCVKAWPANSFLV